MFHTTLNIRKTVSEMVNMPAEGQESVTIPTYVWKKAKRYFKKHKEKLRQDGIKSTSKLITVWIEEKCSEE